MQLAPSREELKQELAGYALADRRRSDLRSNGKPAGAWTRYSKLQTFRAIHSLRGRAATAVYLYLLSVVSGRSKRSSVTRDLTLRITVAKIMERTGLSRSTVLRALDELEGRFIARITGQRADTFYFLNPNSPGEVLQTSPGCWDLLSAQGIPQASYLTFPRDGLACIYTLTSTETAVFVTALELVSVEDDEVLWIGRTQFQAATQLGRDGFRSGLEGCRSKKLFSYSRHGVLEMHDPKTGRPSKRWRLPQGFMRREYQVKDGDFDLNDVAPETRAELVAEHVGIAVPNPAAKRWFNKLRCPFPDCGNDTFAISFVDDAYKCHACGFPTHKVKEGHEGRELPFTADRRELGQGKLAQLISRVKNLPMQEAIEIFKQKDALSIV